MISVPLCCENHFLFRTNSLLFYGILPVYHIIFASFVLSITHLEFAQLSTVFGHVMNVILKYVLL